MVEEKKNKLSSSVILFRWEIMAVSKLPSNWMQKEPDESSDVWHRFGMFYLWLALICSQVLPGCAQLTSWAQVQICVCISTAECMEEKLLV